MLQHSLIPATLPVPWNYPEISQDPATCSNKEVATLIISGTGNTATGGTRITNGTVTVSSGSLLGTGALTLAQASATDTTLTLNNTSQSVGSLNSSWTQASGTRDQRINLNGTALTVNQTTDGTFGTGAVATLTSTIVGTGSLIKTGAAMLTLSSANSYSGGTTIKAGTLALGSAGSIASSSSLTVGDGGSSGAVLDTTAKAGLSIGKSQTLAGIGTVNVGSGKTLTIQGTHSVGNSGTNGGVGTQTVIGNLSYASDSIFNWDLNDNSTTAGFDKVATSGSVAVSNLGTVFNVILGTTALAGILDSGNGFWNAPHGTQSWSMTSIFGQALHPSSQFASVATSQDVSSYGSFTINGSSLTWTAVPEPTSALAGILLGAGLLRRRRAA
jgi:autotransporter-associated beta strand protein